MARVARIAGALLLETCGPKGEASTPEKQYFLVGNTKEPCDFAAHGFEPPGEIDAASRPYLRLLATRVITLTPPWLDLGVEGEAGARLLSARLLITRNGSVSDRLWRMITNPEAPEEEPSRREVPAEWLAQIPAPVWDIVRDTVLRCS